MITNQLEDLLMESHAVRRSGVPVWRASVPASRGAIDNQAMQTPITCDDVNQFIFGIAPDPTAYHETENVYAFGDPQTTCRGVAIPSRVSRYNRGL